MAIKVFIIEDHHLMVEGYKRMLASLGCPIEISAFSSLATAHQFLNEPKGDKNFDMAFIDWNLPVVDSDKLANGGHLVPLIRKYSSHCKIIVLTSHIEGFILYEIKQNVNPHALLTKIDFSIADLSKMIDRIQNGEAYYSPTVYDQVRLITSKRNYLDNYNRQIITLLSKGVMTKNLPQFLPLSISAIDKRKAQIKDYFLLDKGNDDDIVNAARKAGFI